MLISVKIGRSQKFKNNFNCLWDLLITYLTSESNYRCRKIYNQTSMTLWKASENIRLSGACIKLGSRDPQGSNTSIYIHAYIHIYSRINSASKAISPISALKKWINLSFGRQLEPNPNQKFIILQIWMNDLELWPMESGRYYPLGCKGFEFYLIFENIWRNIESRGSKVNFF
jgi:hypothetical protein